MHFLGGDIVGKYDLRLEAREKLAKPSGVVLSHPGLNLAIEGYTDKVGSDEINQKLSEKCAESVRSYLVAQGLLTAARPRRASAPQRPYPTMLPLLVGNKTAEWKLSLPARSSAHRSEDSLKNRGRTCPIHGFEKATA